MKHLNTIISTVLMTTTLCLPWQVKAQSPEKMSYQAVVRDASDKLVIDQVVGMQISILQGSADGTAVYTETHTPTSNANGLVSIEIGNGTVVSGNFSNINWANGSYFIKTETDPSGGTHFTIAGTSQLLSVPYALHAKTAENISGGISENEPIYNADPAMGTSNLNEANDPDKNIKAKHFTNGGEPGGEDRTLGNTDNFALGLKTNDITRLQISNDGNVGIGITSPEYLLDVNGTIRAEGFEGLNNQPVQFTDIDVSDGIKVGANSITIGKTTNTITFTTNPGIIETDGQLLTINAGATSDILLNPTGTGNIGIGNASPSTKLDVNGVITAIGGTSTNWNTAYNWGNHASAGYLSSFTETDPLFTAWDKNYADLTGTPTLSIANWNTAHSWGDHTGLYRTSIWVPAWTDIFGKPTFATVATSGSYADLTNKPANATTTVDGFISSTDKTKLDAITGTNTGDQDILGITTNSTAITALQTEQTTQNTAIALNTAKVGLSPGTIPGQMQYWNGTAWVMIAATANEGATLQMIGGVPTWTRGTPPPTVPDAPTILIALEGNAQAMVTFTAPASDGGSAITGYTVTSSPGGFIGAGTSSPITVTGLTNGTAYTFTVTATNAIGLSTASSASNSVIPTTPPPLAAGEVYNPTTGKIWMDRNLGATQVATSNDAASFGDLYQWGRGTDGHQLRTSGTTSTLSTSADVPGHGNFILAPYLYDWRVPGNNNLWQGINGTNNPCPAGYRIPTETELDTERASWSSNDATGAFASPLNFPVAGFRHGSNGLFYGVGSSGRCWSSAVDGTRARYLHFGDGDADMGSDRRSHGCSVRCIKD